MTPQQPYSNKRTPEQVHKHSPFQTYMFNLHLHKLNTTTTNKKKQ